MQSIIGFLSKNYRLFLFFGWLFFPLANLSAQSNIVASLDFDPRVHGFSFKNYKNVGNNWKDDLGKEDLIRMFGVRASCKSGDNAKNCVLKVAAEKWQMKQLKAMNIGHCEGIGVAGLRMKTGLPFKRRVSPAHFQSGAKSPFSLRLDQNLENYIAYFWITQTLKEVVAETQETTKAGPVGIVKMLINSMRAKKDTYLIGIKKSARNILSDGHAFAPIAVEDGGNFYKIHIYDNNFPGETRYIYVNKTGTQQWSYNSTANPNAKPDYIGDTSTQTLDLTATSWREGKCFDSYFANDIDVGCGIETAFLKKSPFIGASFLKTNQTGDEDGEDAEFFLTGEGDMLVIDGNGNSLGYDPETDEFYDEIENGYADYLIGGFGVDLPNYIVPYEETDNPYTIVFSGRNLRAESTFDFVFSAPGFTVGFDGIRLDPNETLTATISPNGEQISFRASADTETPEVFYSFDSADAEDASYTANIKGIALTAGKSLTYEFDLENGKLYFGDDDGNEDNYDIDLTRLNADGTEEEYSQEDLNIGKADKYEMNFGDWDGDGTMCFKDDEDNDGFDDEECSEQPNEVPQKIIKGVIFALALLYSGKKMF